MDYFQFYNFPIKFTIDKVLLRSQYLERSKQYHPDFFANEREDVKNEMLTQSTLNNNAFKTLNNDALRLRYVLEITGILEDSDKEILPQDFLMDMLELNEAILEMHGTNVAGIKTQVSQIEEDLKSALNQRCQAYDETGDKQLLHGIKTDYLKQKYLLRIKEAMNKQID
jgi:molecular chaperone HscB